MMRTLAGAPVYISSGPQEGADLWRIGNVFSIHEPSTQAYLSQMPGLTKLNLAARLTSILRPGPRLSGPRVR